MSYIHGTFKDVENKTVEVRINTSSGNNEIVIGNGHDSDVYFSSDPVTISMQLEDMFEVIIKKSASISLQSKIYLGDILFAGKPNDVSVTIYRDNRLVFDGYLEANSFDQPWAHQIETFELNCVDHLSLLEYKYWTDTMSYNELLNDVNNYTFLTMLSKIGLNSYNVYYDNSKNVGGQSIWNTAGISLNVFLGDSEDKVMNYEEILTHILRYFNLHIIQEGSDLYIFDWNTITSNTVSWVKLFGNSNSPVSLSNISVTKNSYSDDSSSLSMSEVYNQIQVKCKIDDAVEVIPSMLDTGDLYDYYNHQQLCITEAWYDGASYKLKDTLKSFFGSNMFSNENSIEVNYGDVNSWHAQDWYMKWLYNPKWSLHYDNSIIDSFVPYDGSNPAYQTKILQLLYENRFMPAFISIGSGSEMKNGAQHRTSRPSLSNYLVISGCAGWSVDSDNQHYGDCQFASYNDMYAAIRNAASKASSSGCLASYDSGTAINVSPTEDDKTNFIIISGSITLEPRHIKMGSTSSPSGYRARQFKSGDNASWGNVIAHITDSSLYWAAGDGYRCQNNGVNGHYQQVPWTNRYDSVSGNSPVVNPSVNFLSPPVNKRGIDNVYWSYSKFVYNMSKTTEGWSQEDTINKISVLECELKIGDKYCVEDLNNLDTYKCPTFHWYTAEECEQYGYPNKSFTIGFDPVIGENILGKEFQLTNTSDGRVNSKDGMAIPIKKSDALSGTVTFKIKGVMDLQWDTYIHQDRSSSSSYVHIEGTTHLWPYISALWIKDFNLYFDGENNATSKNDKDLIYMSDESHNYIKKRDDIEFCLNTQLGEEEAANYGLDTSLAYSNVINMAANLGLGNITAPNGTDRAEKLYVDQYWKLYNVPKVIMNTQLHNSNYSIFNTFTFNGFGKTIPLGIDINLKRNVVDLKCRQI